MVEMEEVEKWYQSIWLARQTDRQTQPNEITLVIHFAIHFAVKCLVVVGCLIRKIVLYLFVTFRLDDPFFLLLLLQHLYSSNLIRPLWINKKKTSITHTFIAESCERLVKATFVATTKQEHKNPLNLTTNQVLQLFNVRKHTLGTVLVFFFSLLFQ